MCHEERTEKKRSEKIEDNQIGTLVFCNEELDKLFEYLNLLDCLIDCIS